jgi:hypothetical protein
VVQWGFTYISRGLNKDLMGFSHIANLFFYCYLSVGVMKGISN